MRAQLLLATMLFATLGIARAISTQSSGSRQSDRPAAESPACFGDRVRNGALSATEVLIEGGAFQMGTNAGYPNEGPATERIVAAFWIDRHEVTNAQFAEFVAATGYVTVAEREIDGRRGSAVFTPPEANMPLSAASWWKFVDGASWRRPDGPDSSIDGKDEYPAVHIAYEDADAYAKWAGRRLPTEEEWEYAARGALTGATYEWGEETPDAGAPKANTWQGVFPVINTSKDGFAGLAPVGCFEPNSNGLFDMTGNVWEWTSTSYFAQHSNNENLADQGYDPRQPGVSVNVLKGGSYLCAANYCARYRPAARHPQDLTLGTSHIGFRTVRSE